MLGRQRCLICGINLYTAIYNVRNVHNTRLHSINTIFSFLTTGPLTSFKCCIDYWAQPRLGYKNTLKVNKRLHRRPSQNKLTTAPTHHRLQFPGVTSSYKSSNRLQNKLKPGASSGHKILPECGRMRGRA